MGLLSKLKTALGLGDRPAQGKPDAPRPKANAADGQRPAGDKPPRKRRRRGGSNLNGQPRPEGAKDPYARGPEPRSRAA